MTARFYLVGCGRKKLATRAPARELYVGTLFRKQLAWAEGRARFDLASGTSSPSVHVLSARHGLTSPEAFLEPYDLRIEDLPTRERLRWAEEVSVSLAARVTRARATSPHDDVEVIILAGAAYVEPLRLELANYRRRWAVRDPLAGLQVGERLAWLNARLTGPTVAR